jgi:hypothetical protein
MNPPKVEESRRAPEGDDLGMDYAGAGSEEQVGLQYDEAGALVAGTFAFSTGREQTEDSEGSGEEEEGSSDDDDSEEDEKAAPTGEDEEESWMPLIEEINDDEVSDVESMESESEAEVVADSPDVDTAGSSELPYLFDAPTKYEELVSLLDNRSVQDCDTILTRVRALYNPKLAHENKEKLEVFNSL